MGRKNQENRKAHKKKIDQKKRAKTKACNTRAEKLKQIQDRFKDLS